MKGVKLVSMQKKNENRFSVLPYLLEARYRLLISDPLRDAITYVIYIGITHFFHKVASELTCAVACSAD